MLSLTTPLVMRFVLAAAVTLPVAAYAADAPHADAAAKDACIKACNECLRVCRECILGCDCAGCENVIRRAKTGHASAPKTGHRVGGIGRKNPLVRTCWQGV